MPLVGRAPGFQPRCLRNPCSSRLNAHSQTKLSRIRLFSSKMPHPYFCVKHFPARQSVTVHIKTQKNISKKSPSMVLKKKAVNIGGWPDWFERDMAQLSTMVMGCHIGGVITMTRTMAQSTCCDWKQQIGILPEPGVNCFRQWHQVGIKFIDLFGDRGHRGPYSPYKLCNYNLYIGIIIFPHITHNIQVIINLRKKQLK